MKVRPENNPQYGDRTANLHAVHSHRTIYTILPLSLVSLSLSSCVFLLHIHDNIFMIIIHTSYFSEIHCALLSQEMEYSSETHFQQKVYMVAYHYATCPHSMFELVIAKHTCTCDSKDNSCV